MVEWLAMIFWIGLVLYMIWLRCTDDWDWNDPNRFVAADRKYDDPSRFVDAGRKYDD
jgi:hypothetical protein